MESKLLLMLNNKYKTEPELYLRNVILMDNQSILDLICNKRFTSEVNKFNIKLKVQGNEIKMLVNHRSKITENYQTTCFSNKSITNIVSIKNMTKQYIVTYDTNYETSVMHSKESGLPNMELQMNSLGLHMYYPFEPNKSNKNFINTFSENKKAFNKREIKGKNMAR